MRRDSLAGGMPPFETSHRLVPAAYLACVVTMTFLVLEPVVLTCSCAGALLLSLALRGRDATAAQLAWLVPLALLLILVNPLVAPRGATQLLRLGVVSLRLEGLCYGACMGLMLLAVVLWLSCAEGLLGAGVPLDLLGARAPHLAVMLSLAAQLLPQSLRRLDETDRTLASCTAARALGEAGVAGAFPQGLRVCPRRWRPRLARGSRALTSLLAWSLEDALERAQAMRARAWGACPARTRYDERGLRRRDVLALAALLTLSLVAVWGAVRAGRSWQFYPTLGALSPWWRYAPVAVLSLLPGSLCLVRRHDEKDGAATMGDGTGEDDDE
ncbi:energy-coupling factor transporter transmembrane component T [Olsenella sp. HMSC062G07]|uniref:energy-coupling factor transporter transmembrane component T n=1 Tax=Olsenella sp. HMSC062G07 TaxID=1739330 RepID=UPI0008A1EF60|nr:energy-coupling factor transporter transmembrane component T [Olsenella sp. HMSC062G07]OFK23339.1 hypothetical protein HMPREF2826_05380 [Olsenella sp. HMSC062G07]